MSKNNISRRQMIRNSGLAVLGAATGFGLSKSKRDRAFRKTHNLPFRISMNTSTLQAYQLPADEQIKLVAGAGFEGIEMWVRDIRSYIDAGGTPEELRDLLDSNDLLLENMIGFSEWISDDAETRAEALSLLRSDMEMIAAMGGEYIAAPVQGIDSIDGTKLEDYAERYNTILELGEETGVTPILEVWGTGALHKVSDCIHIAIGSGHPDATVLLDFYHVYRGGNDWDTVNLVNAGKLPVMHMNDYPANPSRDQLTDADRVFPGEGICPYNEVIPKLYNAGFRGGFSVELFNREYWDSMDAETILAESYDRTYNVLADAMAGVE
ncbi:MAG: sugar phosphate isomerase/epimerase [Balneolaceae bacterium]|nr:sugar phosphate isomerase/epimerase [Balneolaceae bacterium]